MRTAGNENYEGAEIGWSVYGEGNSYGSEAWITIHAGSHTSVYKITGGAHDTMEEAEKRIIGDAKAWIDTEIAAGRLKPIK
ncbi:hypothetical protein BN59_00611 [Legionella massiliensis]|uniref:Uncharacterized protein n=1 Tax=Legionella massiliensis TaxID=1034943 RepID=A0A078KXC1_9GAMM|nr:hypothetical protein [Legionella massiliensis]CDZ76343.1 hypothetical protein BN59_00611 [Legionella massiliensis]CEE12081.1 hypothetical protein BN1094_00611 [Legionella massiliensis]